MNDFKVGQQVEISTNPGTSSLYKRMLAKMNNPTRVLGTIVYMTNEYNILIHSNQLEEFGLGHDGGVIGDEDFKPSSEKGHWWVFASQLKPYHEQLSFSDLDKLFKEKIKYYIIKDLDTGLYYRGKGQNRWGKYYNQASIFRNLAQANNSVEQLKIYDKSNAVAIEIEITELNQEFSFDECIKEWEEKGFSVNVRTTEIFITNSNTVDKEEDEIGINIRLDLKTIFYMNDVELSFDLHNLLSKTLKVLEVEKKYV